VKPVVCAVDANSPEKDRSTRPAPVGNFSEGADYSPRRVLVVDDEPLIRWSVSETLSDLGCEVEQAADAAAAVRATSGTARPFDVVVLDLRLPDMNDLTLLSTLRRTLPGATLVLMTALGSADIIKDAEALGASVIHKPFELDALGRLVLGTNTETR